MTNAHSFPLRRLPFLAQELVIQRMLIKEQLDFSTLSKISKRTVRTSTSRQKFDLAFHFQTNVIITLTNQSLDQSLRFELNETTTYPTISKMKGLTVMILGSFKNVGVSLRIWGSSPYRSIFELVPVLNQLNIRLNDILVICHFPNDELCEHALRASESAKELHFYCKTSPSFHPQELGVFNLELLHINFASWVSLDHLVNNFMNCDEVCLSGSKMSIGEVNQFFKTWVAGSKMRYFRWTYTTSIVGPSVLPAMLDGIPSVAVKKATIQNDVREFEEDDCFMIEQVGGAKAIVYREYRGYCPVIMTTEFSLD